LDPLVTRSLNICKRVLAREAAGPGDVARFYSLAFDADAGLAAAVKRSEGRLGIPLEYSIDQ